MSSESRQTVPLEERRKEASGGGTGVSPMVEALGGPSARLVRRRPAVLAQALLARVSRRRAIVVWPDLERPHVAADLSAPGPAGWIDATFGAETGPGGLRGLLRRGVGAATWLALRGAAILVGGGPSVAATAAERALARPLARPSVALYSPSGSHGAKANLFVFEGRARDPTVLVVVMPPGEERLQRELAAVEALRARTSSEPSVADALPLAAIWTGRLVDRLVAVFPIDPLCGSTGAPGRGVAFGWLRDLHAVTATDASWSEGDVERELATVVRAWSALRPDAERALHAAARRLQPLTGTAYRASVVHGDFWRGNLAVRGDRLRVYDWEFWQQSGHPLFDPWTYELAELKEAGAADAPLPLEPLGQALDRVRAEAVARGLEYGAADAFLIPVLAQLAERSRRAPGPASPSIASYRKLMATAERLLAP